MKYLGMTVLGLVFALLSAQAAYAYEGEIRATTNVGVSVTGAGVDVGASGGAQASSSSTGSGSNNGASNGATSNAEASGDTSITVDVGVFHITRADIDVSGNAEGSVTAPASVTSDATLSTYARSVVRADADVNAVEVSDTAVSVAYKARARLFGLFPIFVNATAVVEANGSTTIHYPWYAFLATKDSASLEADVKAATNATLATQMSGTLSASTKAALLNEIKSAMKSNLEASLAAEGSANASTQ